MTKIDNWYNLFGLDYNPYDMYPDTGKNANTYPQQQQLDPNNSGSIPIYQYPSSIFGGKK